MDTIENRLQAARARQTEAQRRVATAEAKLDQVHAQREQLMTGLKEQGFESVEDARKAIATLKTETEDILADIEKKVSGL